MNPDDEFDVGRFIAPLRSPQSEVMPYHEIANRLGMPTSTVKITCDRALKKAAKILRARHPEYADIHTFAHHEIPLGDQE